MCIIKRLKAEESLRLTFKINSLRLKSSHILFSILFFTMLTLSLLAAEDPDELRPKEHFCPIGMVDIMINPVVASDGHSYERGKIEQWIRERRGGRVLSPITGEPLPSLELIPNFTLKKLISDWRAPVHEDDRINALNQQISTLGRQITALMTVHGTMRSEMQSMRETIRELQRTPQAVVDMELEELVRRSFRSCVIYFQNDSDEDLHLSKSSVKSGIWTKSQKGIELSPPQKIAKGQCVLWASESDGFGTEGKVEYRFREVSAITEVDCGYESKVDDCVESEPSMSTIFLHWNNPFLGRNSYDFGRTSRIKKAGASGNNAVVRFFFK